MKIAAVHNDIPSRLVVSIDRNDSLGNPLGLIVLTDERRVLQPPVAIPRLLASGWSEYGWDANLAQLLELVPQLRSEMASSR